MKNLYRLLLMSALLGPLVVISQNVKKSGSLKKLQSNEKPRIEKINHLLTLDENFLPVFNFDQQKQLLDSALILSKQINYQQGITRYYNELGRLLSLVGKYDEAFENYFRSLQLGVEQGDSVNVAKVCINMAVTFSVIGKSESATKYINRALKVAEVSEDTILLIRAYDKSALLKRRMGNYEEAIDTYEKAIQIAEVSGNDYQAANSTLNLGIVYKFQENYPKALDCFLKGYPFFDSIGKLEILLPLNNCIGTIYLHQKEYPESLKFLNSALIDSKALGYNSAISENLNYLSEVNFEMKNYNDAFQQAEQALKLYTEIQDQYGIGTSLINLAKVYEKTGELDKAMKNYKAALQVSEVVAAKDNISSSLYGIGNIFYLQAANSSSGKDKSKYDLARENFLASLKLSLEIGQLEKIMNTYHFLYQIDSATENYSSAIEKYKLYNQYSDSVYGTEIKIQLAQSEYNFLRDQKNKEILLLANENEIKSLQISKQKIQRDGLVIIFGFIILLIAVIIRTISLRKRIEKQKAVVLERERISADLHDDIGSGLSKIILMSEVMKNENGSPEVKNKLNEISKASIELSKNISEVIWALNSRNDFLDNLVAYIRKFSGSYFENSAIYFKMVASKQIPHTQISSEQRRNIFLVVKEALHNVVKHSRATEVELTINYNRQKLSIIIWDNGIGINHSEKNQFGNGLIHMQERLQSMGGDFFIENKKGTAVTLSVPV